MSNSKTFANWPASRFSTAPMLDLTDRHCRYFHRLMTKEALLYTEMVTTGAIIYGRGNYLDYNKEEHPLALQLGGSDPGDLAFCAKLAADRGYDEINLNVGCPSDRVQNGMFGACLMAHAPLVAQCVSAMRDKVDIPVSVKTRIGIDEHDSYEFLTNFIETVHNESGCTDFIIHARKAWLKGLSPKENRDIPPLNYPRAYKVKQDFPNLNISVNGGIKTIAEANLHLQHLDGVMLGREIYQNPYILATVDRDIFNKETKILSRHAIVEAMFPYIEKQLSYGVPLGHMSRHILGIFQGQQGAKAWRRYISENAFKKEAGVHTIKDALKFVSDNYSNI